ncbi:hypothetical protein ATC03_05860 [Agromyces aureus]|uniref:ABC3 transporter permease protein domain-containing protein n=1 Tax=Agromyces aureus TaxID=453304 RepID=A0A191WDN6_9MICO|nr:hypothetical protein ATC03_05860 [Agromyces aureus]
MFAALAAVVLVLAFLGTAIVDSLASASLSGLRNGLAAATGTDGAARWQIRISGDPVEQADAAASVLDRLLVPRGAEWSRSVQASPVDARGGDGAFDAVILADDGLADRSTLASGVWPDDPDAAAIAARAASGGIPTTVQAAAAEAQGLELGDVVELGGVGSPATPPLVVVGTWTPDDAAAPVWFDDPVVSAGAVEGAVGPFVVADEGALADLPAAVVVRWTAITTPASSTPETAADLRAVLPNVEPALRAADGIGTDGLGTSGGLVGTLDRLLAGLTTVRAVAPLPVLLLGFAGFAAVDRLAALLAAGRRGETQLLRARGASAVRLASITAGEVATIALPTALAGAAVAEAVLRALRPDEGRSWAIAALVAGVATLGAVALVAGRAWWEATRPLLRGSGDEVGRMPRAAVAGGVLLVVVAAAVTLWQFRLYGSPLVANASGVLEVDPVAVLAPVLVLVALALVGNALARPVARVLERLAVARPGLVPALPMRQLARRAGLYASASLVTVLAIGGLTLAAAFAGSWQSFDRAASAMAVGDDVRVAYAGRSLVHDADPLALVDPFAGAPGVDSSLPVFRGEARIGSEPATLIALPAADASADAGAGAGSSAAADGGSTLDPSALQSVQAPELPSGASTLDVDVQVTAPGVPGSVAVAAWVLGPDGDAARLPAGSFDVAAGGGAGRVALPELGGLRLLGFDATLDGSQGLGTVEVRFGDVRIDGAPAASDLAADTVVRVSAKTPTARTPVAGAAEVEPVPAVLGAPLAARIDVRPGDAFTFRLLTGGADVTAVVAGIAPAVPGAGGSGLLVDLAGLSQAAFVAGAGVPAYTDRWISTSEPSAVADGIREERSTALTTTTLADASSAPLIGPAVAALWAGAGGALLFAAVAVAALTAALSRARFGEVVVLRALGMPATLQARARSAELAAALGTAVVVGAAVGALTAAVTARELARAAVAGAPASLGVDLTLDVVPWALGLVAFVAATALIGRLAAASVRRLAATPGIREEER